MGETGTPRYYGHQLIQTRKLGWTLREQPALCGLASLSLRHLLHEVRAITLPCTTPCPALTPCAHTWCVDPLSLPAKDRDLAQALHRVLHCMAVLDPEMGYSQGMNFLAQALVKEVRV